MTPRRSNMNVFWKDILSLGSAWSLFSCLAYALLSIMGLCLRVDLLALICFILEHILPCSLIWLHFLK
jgi:hypothetical protein